MPPKEIAPKLLSWASTIDDGTVTQAARAARLPFVEGHVALMPDAHVGIGATVGSVIPTRDAIIPSAVGVDFGCGRSTVTTTSPSSSITTARTCGSLVRVRSRLQPVTRE